MPRLAWDDWVALAHPRGDVHAFRRHIMSCHNTAFLGCPVKKGEDEYEKLALLVLLVFR